MEDQTTSKSKYKGKTDPKVKDKIKAKKEKNKKKKDDRNAKLQEKKRIRVQQKHTKKLVADMVLVFKTIFPSFEENLYLRKYFNLNQFLKLEMFDNFEKAKEEYKGDNESFTPVLEDLLIKVYSILNPPVTEEEYVSQQMKTYRENLDELMLLYVKG